MPVPRENTITNTRRTGIVALSVVGATAMTAVSLLQTGVISHLPDPPGRWFDSDRVNLSDAAFRLGVPDGLLGLASYLANIPLALRASSTVLVAKATLDALAAAKYTLVEMPRLGVACPYCIAAAGSSFGIFALALAEARR